MKPTMDDLKFHLTELLDFYDKPLTDKNWHMWWSVLKQMDPYKVQQALKDWPAIGKFSPKPANIVEIVRGYPKNVRTVEVVEAEEPVDCPPKIRAAWRWYVAITTKGTTLECFQGALDVTAEQEDEFLLIVNQEAKRLNQPNAIDDRHKLVSVWGREGTVRG